MDTSFEDHDNRPDPNITSHRRRGGYLDPSNGGKIDHVRAGQVAQLLKLYGLGVHANAPVMVALTIWHAPIELAPLVAPVTDIFCRIRWGTARGHAEAEADVTAEGTVLVLSGADALEASVSYTGGPAGLLVDFEGQANYVGTVATSGQRSIRHSAVEVLAGVAKRIPSFARGCYVLASAAGAGATSLRFLADAVTVLGVVGVSTTQGTPALIPPGARFFDFVGAPPLVNFISVFPLRI
jgi:hypothetical protein